VDIRCRGERKKCVVGVPEGADAATIRAKADAIRKQFQTGET
jgi:hypothetical protein